MILSYLDATKLLTDPTAKLSGKVRRELKRARLGVLSMQKTPKRDIREFLARRMAGKNLRQLRNCLVRGHRRAVQLSTAAEQTFVPSQKAQMLAFARLANAMAITARAEISKRTTIAPAQPSA